MKMLEQKNIDEIVLEAIYNSGICVEGYPENDIDLAGLIDDSLQFVMLVVNIEEELMITLPEDFLLIENYHSLRGFINMVKEVVLEGENSVL